MDDRRAAALGWARHSLQVTVLVALLWCSRLPCNRAFARVSRTLIADSLLQRLRSAPLPPLRTSSYVLRSSQAEKGKERPVQTCVAGNWDFTRKSLPSCLQSSWWLSNCQHRLAMLCCNSCEIAAQQAGLWRGTGGRAIKFYRSLSTLCC